MIRATLGRTPRVSAPTWADDGRRNPLAVGLALVAVLEDPEQRWRKHDRTSPKLTFGLCGF